MISLPDMVDLHSDSIQVGRLKLTSYGRSLICQERFIPSPAQMITLL